MTMKLKRVHLSGHDWSMPNANQCWSMRSKMYGIDNNAGQCFTIWSTFRINVRNLIWHWSTLIRIGHWSSMSWSLNRCNWCPEFCPNRQLSSKCTYRSRLTMLKYEWLSDLLGNVRQIHCTYINFSTLWAKGNSSLSSMLGICSWENTPVICTITPKLDPYQGQVGSLASRYTNHWWFLLLKDTQHTFNPRWKSQFPGQSQLRPIAWAS